MGNLGCGKKKQQKQNSPLTVHTSSIEVFSTISHPQNSPMFGIFLFFPDFLVGKHKGPCGGVSVPN